MNYENMSINELLDICSTYNITGLNNQPKDVIIAIIKNKVLQNLNNEIIDLESKSIDELLDICSSYNIVGLENQPKDILITIIRNKLESQKLDHLKADLTIDREDDDIVNSTITISCGSNQDKFNVVGKKVSDVANLLREVLNIPESSICYVNENQVDGEYILKVNDKLDFIQQAGTKGFIMLFI